MQEPPTSHPVTQWFSNLRVHQNRRGGLLNHRLLSSSLRTFDSVSLGQGSRISISNKFLVAMDTTSPGITLGEQNAVQSSKQSSKNMYFQWFTIAITIKCRLQCLVLQAPLTLSLHSLNTHKHRPSHPASKASSVVLNFTLLLLTSIPASCCSSQRKCLHFLFAHQYPQPLAPVVPLPLTRLS